MTQGPIPCSSMALLTGSVVVPGMLLTSAVSCPVKALMSDDLPVLRRPKRAMCRRLADGVDCKLMSETEITFTFFYFFQVSHGYLLDFRIRDVLNLFLYQSDALGVSVGRSIIL